jgi:lysophospholipase L1-like esterase
MPDPFRIVNLGDSVPWGQGLLDGEKYDVLVKQALQSRFPGGVTLQRLAHSGAVIGARPTTGNPAPGEVPVPHPTIIEQCDTFADSPATVDLVLVNGGINDVGVATILNPFALVPPLQTEIQAACHDGMLALLRKVSAKFSKASCRILVTGYYTIFSAKSNPLKLPHLMAIHGVGIPMFVAHLDLVNPVVDRCEQFFAESSASLQSAVADAGDPRIAFVASGFTDDNAVFVPGTSFLWGLDEFLNPEDPVAGQRRPQCNQVFDDILEIAQREECYRASAGHPNIAGARQYASQILNAVAH